MRLQNDLKSGASVAVERNPAEHFSALVCGRRGTICPIAAVTAEPAFPGVASTQCSAVFPSPGTRGDGCSESESEGGSEEEDDQSSGADNGLAALEQLVCEPMEHLRRAAIWEDVADLPPGCPVVRETVVWLDGKDDAEVVKNYETELQWLRAYQGKSR